MAKKNKVLDAKAEERLRREAEKRLEKQREIDQQVDNEVADRTSRFDPLLKDRARAVGVNPDNFEDEVTLNTAVEQQEEIKKKQEEEQADAES